MAIVESETVIIASVYLPGRIWLAAGSLTNLNPEICGVLKGRRVTLYPDIGDAPFYPQLERWGN